MDGARVIRLHGRIQGLQQTQATLGTVLPILLDEMDAAVRASLLQTTRVAQKAYLSGPRPMRLGVVTNRLRGSLTEGRPDFVMDVKRQALKITGTIGTNVVYAPIHEFGGEITPKKGRYLAIPTALAKTPAGALKAKYQKPLREIADLFLTRTRSGTLFAAEKIPAAGRQRRSTFRILFWLVTRVKIPARPFLNPALRDTTSWITNRFTQGLRRTEQRITDMLNRR